MLYSYPNFPNLSKGITTFIIQLFEWFIEVPLIALANFIGGMAGSATAGSENSVNVIFGFIGSTWSQSVASFKQFGVFAPLIASLIWGASIMVLIFFIFKAIQLATRETEED